MVAIFLYTVAERFCFNMKTVLSFLRVLMASALVFAAVSCSSGDTSSSDETSLSYLYLTQNRGYIGGSLIWNPGKGSGQLQAGTKVAVRLGKLTSREVSIQLRMESPFALCSCRCGFKRLCLQ